MLASPGRMWCEETGGRLAPRDHGGQSGSEPVCDAHHVDLAQGSVGRDQLGELLAPGDPSAVELKGLRKEAPFSIDEAQGGVDGHLRAGEGVAHRLDLPTESLDQLGAVPSVDVEAEVFCEPSALVPLLHPTLVGLGIDDPDAGRGDREVIDVAAGLRNLAVMEEDGPVTDPTAQAFSKAALPF